MSKGFVFKSRRCVGCGSCSAACNLYNGWETRPRNIYTFNKELSPELPVFNMSLACNHCAEAACINGCPSGALSRDMVKGIVVLDGTKCLGCRYCQWNCPFDAPKYNQGKRIIEKCNLCLDSADELPSCATACPTGALRFMEFSDGDYNNLPGWLPGKKLKPSLSLTGNEPVTPEIIPSGNFAQKEHEPEARSLTGEWSLVMFTFISMVAVSLQASAFIKGTYNGIFFLLVLFSAGLISLFHLGRPFRAWKAILNPLSSPLSREIWSFILFVSLAVAAAGLRSPEISLAASVAGMILLVSIDSVYIHPDRKSFFHSGQTFISGLLLVAYLTGNILPFTFIVILKVMLSAWKITGKNMQALRFFRIAVLAVVWAGFVSGLAEKSTMTTALIVSAELLDRILFYMDFEPENIRQVTYRYINDLKYEKKRG